MIINIRRMMDTEHLKARSPLFEARIPILLWVILVAIGTIVFEWMIQFDFVSSMLFMLVIIMHITLHWFSPMLVKHRAWLYFTIQALLVYGCAFFMPTGFVVTLFGLYPVLIGQSIGVYYEKRKVWYLSLLSYALFCLAVGFISDWNNLKLYIPLLIMMMVVVLAYSVLYFNQVQARIRTQSFLRDLERAHRQVEELTLANERQRMARDLHDTLAQGLAGVIMKLEAIDAHLVKGNAQRAHQIVQVSMVQARQTLSDARGAIDNLRLRSMTEIDFEAAIRDEAQRFAQATGIDVTVAYKLSSSLPLIWMEHGLFIISECLTNIARHARASQAAVIFDDTHGMLHIQVRDNGVGFNAELIGKQPGHYGLLGMAERVRILGGQIDIKAKGDEGTQIDITAPLNKGEQYDA